MSDANTPPRYTGPGSPQDVPPLPGELGVDPSTLAATDPRRAGGARPGRHRHGRAGTEGRRQPLPEVRRHRHPPQAGLGPAHLRLLPQRVAAASASRSSSGSAKDTTELEGTVISSGARDIAADAAVLVTLQVHRLRRRGDDQHAERDDGALPLVPARVRRQRAGAERRGAGRRAAVPHQEGRRGGAHPPVRAQAPAVRAEGSSRRSSRPRTSSRCTCRT